MKKYGLPTFPINDGMILGSKRDWDEIEWLLEHGVIQSDLYRYRKILKISSDCYQLLKNDDDRHDNPDQKTAEATNLQTLLQENKIDLATWYWYGATTTK